MREITFPLSSTMIRWHDQCCDTEWPRTTIIFEEKGQKWCKTRITTDKRQLKESRELHVTTYGIGGIIRVRKVPNIWKLHIRFTLHGLKGYTKIMGWEY